MTEHAMCLKELVVLETACVKLIQKLWSAWQQIHRSVLGALGEGESITIQKGFLEVMGEGLNIRGGTDKKKCGLKKEGCL